MLFRSEPEAANPGAGLFDLDFGFSVATSNGKVVVGNPDTADYGDGGNSHSGKGYVYEASSGQLLHTLLATDELVLGETSFGSTVRIDGNVIAVLGSSSTLNGPLTYVFDTATGSLTQTHIDLILSDVHNDQLASRVFVPSVALTTFGSIVDADSGTVIDTIPLPPGYDPETSTFLSSVTLFGNRLLVGEGRGAALGTGYEHHLVPGVPRGGEQCVEAQQG